MADGMSDIFLIFFARKMGGRVCVCYLIKGFGIQTKKNHSFLGELVKIQVKCIMQKSNIQEYSAPNLNSA